MKFLFIFGASLLLLGAAWAELTFTNVTLPTILTVTEVDMDAGGGKIAVSSRVFNSTSSDVLFLTCSLTSGSGGAAAAFSWSRQNGSALVKGQTADTANGGNSTGGPFSVSKLALGDWANNAAETVGVYRCSANSANVYPMVLSAPVVKMSDKDYRSSMEGDTMTQSCTVVGFPAANIIWTKDNQTLYEDGERIKFGADNVSLTITSLKQEDAGLYVCSATNQLGLGQAYIKLRVKDRLAALWPFLGILAEVIILVTIILLYEKKRAAQKRTQEEADGGADAGKAGEREANDTDVRHRPVKT